MYDLIILGGGPAGLTAAVYAIRKRLNVLLIAPDLGGKTNGHIFLPDNVEWVQVINGEEIVSRFKSQIEYLEYAQKKELVEQVEAVSGGYAVTTREGNRYETKAVIVATGAGAATLNVPGESQYRMRELAYSAVSYAPLFIDRTVAVVGEGELGARSVLDLAQCARRVYYISPSAVPQEGPLFTKLRASANVTVLESYRVKEVVGAANYAQSIVVTRDGDQTELPVDVTFIEMGLKPNSACVADLVQLNAKQQIVIDSSNHTSAPGIFAAGDVTDTYAEQVLICIGEGAKAALSAYEYILAQ